MIQNLKKPMDRWHKILIGGFILALIYIIYLQGCGKKPSKIDRFVIKDTTVISIVYDTNWYDTTVFKYIYKPIPKPYFDTTYSPDILELIERGRKAFAENEDFDQDFILKYPAIYEGVISDDTVKITYRAEVRGYLDNMKIGYKVLQPYSLTRTEIINIKVLKKEKSFKGLYIGADFESDIDSLMYFEPELSIIFGKWEFSGGISLPGTPKRYKLGLKRVIFSPRR